MVGLLQDSRALQALLQKYRDLPSRLSANPRPKTPEWVRQECPQRRLEVLGYSFLKFSTARFLYYQLGCRATAHQLNDLRERLITNQHLLLLAERLSWSRNRKDMESLVEFLGELKEGRTWHKHPEVDKSGADCVEAAVGLALVRGGEQRALELLSRLGMALGRDSSIEEALQGRSKYWLRKVQPFVPQKSALEEGWSRQELQELGLDDALKRVGLRRLESVVGYKFKEPSFLLQAFTHSSFLDPSHDHCALTESYESLEFLGDALLEYLLTSHLFFRTDFNYWQIKMLKTIILSNIFFAGHVTTHQLENHILHCSEPLHRKIRDFLEAQWWDEAKPQIGHHLVELDLEHEIMPKVLGDIFESLMAAVYLDSGHDLSAVWAVYTKLFPNLEAVIANPPKTLERQLYEEFPDATSTREKIGSKVVVELHLEEGGTTYRGLGYNNKLALIAACSCRCVMAVLEGEESLNQASNSTGANSEHSSTGPTSTNTDPDSSL